MTSMDDILNTVKQFQKPQKSDQDADISQKYNAIAEILTKQNPKFKVLLNVMCKEYVTFLDDKYLVKDPKVFVGSLTLVEAEDKVTVVPYLQCTVCKQRMTGIAFDKEFKFTAVCPKCDPTNTVLEDLELEKQNVLLNFFFEQYRQFIEQTLKQEQESAFKEGLPGLPLQFFQQLVRENKQFDFLQNPSRFFTLNPLTVKVKGEEFRCNNYVEGGVNRFESLKNPQKCPIYSYYCSTDEVKKQLEKDYEETFEQKEFDPSSIIVNKRVEDQKVNENKNEVDPEALRPGHAVVFKENVDSVTKYEIEKTKFFFVKQQYFNQYIEVELDDKIYVLDSNDLIYITLFLSDSKTQMLRKLYGIESVNFKFFPWNLHLPTTFENIKDYFTRLNLGSVKYQAACVTRYEQNDILCLLSEDQKSAAFVQLSELFTERLINEMQRFTSRSLHAAIDHHDLATVAPELFVDEQMDARMQASFQTLIQSKQMADIIKQQCETNFVKLGELLGALADYVAECKNDQSFILLQNFYLYVFTCIKRIKASFPGFDGAGLREIFDSPEALAAEARKLQRLVMNEK